MQRKSNSRPPKEPEDTLHLEDSSSLGAPAFPKSKRTILLQRRARRLASRAKESVLLSLKVDLELYEALVETGEKYHTTIAAVARQSMRDGLRKYSRYENPTLEEGTQPLHRMGLNRSFPNLEAQPRPVPSLPWIDPLALFPSTPERLPPMRPGREMQEPIEPPDDILEEPEMYRMEKEVETS